MTDRACIDHQAVENRANASRDDGARPALVDMHYGLALDFAGRGSRTYGDRLQALAPLLREANDLGYRSISAGESYVFDSSDAMGFHAPNSLVMLAAIAGMTDVPRLVTGALLVSGWNKLRLAYDTALVDQLTDGRLAIGLGLGAASAWGAFGSGETDRAGRMEATVHFLRSAWAGRPIVASQGDAQDMVLVPRPVQPSGPPILIGGGVAASARRAARIGDGYTASTGYTRQRVRQLAAIYNDTAAESPGTVSVNRLALVAKTDAEAHRLAARYFMSLLRAYATTGVIDGATDLSDWEALHRNSCIVGAPDTVAALVQEYREEGATHLMLRIAPGETPVEVAHQTAELFAQEVIPRVRSEGNSGAGRSPTGETVPKGDGGQPSPQPRNDREDL